MNIKKIEELASHIQGLLFKRSNSFSIGALKGNFKGQGLQFKEHQVYSPGDDTRFIDWGLTAKLGKPFIKTFEEDRNVEIYVMIDVTPTLSYGHKGTSKLLAMVELASLIYLLTARTQDRVKVILLTDKILQTPLSNGKRGIVEMLALLDRAGLLTDEGQVERELSLVRPCDERTRFKMLRSALGKNKEVVLLSDFHYISQGEDTQKLFSRRNFHGFRVVAPLDLNESMPFSLPIRGSKKGIGQFRRVFSADQKGLIGKRLRTLRVDRSYLDDFIKDMV